KDQTDADIAINCGEDHPIMRSSELNESNPVVALPVRPPANTAKSKREPIWPPGFALAIVVLFAKKAAGSLLRALHSACQSMPAFRTALETVIEGKMADRSD